MTESDNYNNLNAKKKHPQNYTQNITLSIQYIVLTQLSTKNLCRAYGLRAAHKAHNKHTKTIALCK